MRSPDVVINRVEWTLFKSCFGHDRILHPTLFSAFGVSLAMCSFNALFSGFIVGPTLERELLLAQAAVVVALNLLVNTKF